MVNELKKRYSFDELGRSLAEGKRDELARAVMVYERAAPKDGGLVLLYDGTVKTMTANEVNKLLRKK